MEKLYNDDVNIWVLTAKMEILQVLPKDGDYFCFDIIVRIKELPNPERKMIKKVITLCKQILVNPATSAAAERFSNLTVSTYTKKERTGFPPLTSQTNLPTATQTESVILALFE